jgi:REP element-mobilizing transposase RayT
MGAMKFTISKDTPALFITAVAKNRLPIFQKDAIKKLACCALDEARKSCGFLLFAYVIMLDHIHLLTDSSLKQSEVLRYLKGISAHRMIEYLKEKNYKSSLQKLLHEEWKRKHRYSMWGHESNVFLVTSENTFMQKVNYIHQNPVRSGLVQSAVNYRSSSARIWQRCDADDEMLRVDLDCIYWRRPRGWA